MLSRLTLRRAALALAALVLSLAAPTSAVAHAAMPSAADKDLVTFGIGPGGQAYIDKRSFLSYAAGPGSQLLDKVALFNQSNEPLDVLVYSSDGTTAKDGSLAIRPRAERNTDMGAWVAVGADAAAGRPARDARSLVRVTIPPQSPRKGIGKVVLPMRVMIPTDASPGDHVAGVVVALVARGENPGSQNIELEQRVALRVFLRVSGAIKAGLAVKILKAEYVGGSGLGLKGTTRVSYRVTNTGNVRLGADTRVSVKSWLGLGTTSVDGPSLAELVPGGKAEVTTDVTGTPPSIIQHASVTVTAKAAVGGQPVKLAPARDRVRLWAITWQEIALVLLLLALVLYRRWRKARRPSPQHARPSDPVEPAALVGVALVVLTVVAVLGMGVGKARAAELGAVHVSPTVGHDETLFDGSVADARCPKGTSDSYFTVDGPGLPPDTGFIGQGNASGTGPQSFRGASIANLRTANPDAFQRSGTYVVRFSCVGASGTPSASYTRKIAYEHTDRGSFRILGYPKSQPTRFPLPGATPLPDESPTAAATAVPRATASVNATSSPRGASPSPSSPSSPAASLVAQPLAVAPAASSGFPWTPVLVVLGAAALVCGGLVLRRTRGVRHP